MIVERKYDSPIGGLWISACEDGICRIGYLPANFPFSHSGNSGIAGYLDEACRQLDEYFECRRAVFDLPLVLHGTPFQLEAWKVLQSVPYGTTISYAEEASMMHHPTAYRAAANANHANPIAIVIPCHRVIASGGKIGGYGGGIEKKRFLLELESNRNL